MFSVAKLHLERRERTSQRKPTEAKVAPLGKEAQLPGGAACESVPVMALQTQAAVYLE